MGCGASKIEAQVEPSSSGKPVAQPQREPAATEKVEAKLIVVTAEPPASDRPAPALPPKPLAVSVPAAPAPTPAPNVPKKLVLILGTGVSGQCAKLAEVYGCHHLLVGKLMRSEVMSESDEGRSIAQMMNDGKIIPAAAIAETPIEASAAGTATATFLVDGFPRSADNAKLFAEHVGAPSAAVVLFPEGVRA
ncbi:adenylate kinase-domain-containing protein [Pavlovales sp. CCMP2436]|nr:adenylate kinase-domain-containing protein [Pavlovales sp. CCMP2436]